MTVEQSPSSGHAGVSEPRWEYRATNTRTGEVLSWTPCSAKAAERAKACGYEVRCTAGVTVPVASGPWFPVQYGPQTAGQPGGVRVDAEPKEKN